MPPNLLTKFPVTGDTGYFEIFITELRHVEYLQSDNFFPFRGKLIEPKDINIFNSLHTVPLKSGASPITSEGNRAGLHPARSPHPHPNLTMVACRKRTSGGDVSC